MRSVQTVRFAHCEIATGFLSGVALKGTVEGLILSFLWFDFTHQPSYLPLLHRFMLPGFIATMEALTSDLTSVSTHPMALWEGLVLRFRHGSCAKSDLSAYPVLNFRPFRLQPPQCHFAPTALTRYVTDRGLSRLSHGQTRTGRGIAFARQGFEHS
jgi:hypothetical protein